MEPAENAWPHQQPIPPPSADHVPAAMPLPVGKPAELPWRKNPKLAALLSIFPGLGNVYNGLYLRGFTFFLIFTGLIGLASEEEIFIMAVLFFGFFNVIDAYRQATLINYGYAQDLGLLDMPKSPKAGQGGLIAGAVLTLIGLVGLLQRFFRFDLEFLLDFWPVALMLIGLWLVVGSVRERLKERDQGL